MKSENKNMVLGFGTVMLFFLGLLYSWSIFVEPLEMEFGWSRNQTSIVYTISVVCFQLGILCNGLIEKITSAKFSAYVGLLLISTGLCLCSLTESLLWLCIFYGISCGLGIGICHNAWIARIFSWFPDRSGWASGIALFGYGTGGMILGAFASVLIYSPIGWRTAFLVIGLIVLFVGLISMRFFLPSVNETEHSDKCISQKEQRVQIGPIEMLKQGSFWSFFVWKGLLMSFGMAVIGQAAMIAGDVGAATTLTVLATGLICIGNGCGRVVFGVFSDRFSVTLTMVVIALNFFIFSIILKIAYSIQSFKLITIALVVLGMCYGGTVLMSSNYINFAYGKRNFSINNGISALSSIPFVFINAAGIGFIKANTNSYAQFFLVMVYLSTIAIIAALATPGLINRMYRKLSGTEAEESV